MATTEGLEPSASRLGTRRSNPIELRGLVSLHAGSNRDLELRKLVCYPIAPCRQAPLERPGIEPGSRPWQGRVLAIAPAFVTTDCRRAPCVSRTRFPRLETRNASRYTNGALLELLVEGEGAAALLYTPPRRRWLRCGARKGR